MRYEAKSVTSQAEIRGFALRPSINLQGRLAATERTEVSQ